LQDSGARIGKAHPIAALSGGGPRCRGVVWGMDGDNDVVNDLSEVVRALAGYPLLLRGTDLQLYHLAAVFVANLSLGLMAAATKLWDRSKAPLSSEEALLPLLKTVVANWEELGLARALTGPLVRGDLQAINSSLARLSLEGDGFHRIYRDLGLETLSLVSDQGTMDSLLMAKIAQLLEKGKVLD